MFCLLFIITQTMHNFSTVATKLLDSDQISKLWRIFLSWPILLSSENCWNPFRKFKTLIMLTMRTNQMMHYSLWQKLFSLSLNPKQTSSGNRFRRNTPWWGLFGWKLKPIQLFIEKYIKRYIKQLFSRDVSHTEFVENLNLFIYTFP